MEDASICVFVNVSRMAYSISSYVNFNSAYFSKSFFICSFNICCFGKSNNGLRVSGEAPSSTFFNNSSAFVRKRALSFNISLTRVSHAAYELMSMGNCCTSASPTRCRNSRRLMAMHTSRERACKRIWRSMFRWILASMSTGVLGVHCLDSPPEMLGSESTSARCDRIHFATRFS